MASIISFNQPKKTAREYITAGLVKLSRSDAALYLTALKIEPVATSDPNKTLALKIGGGKAELLYNPNFVSAIGDSPNGSESLKVLLGAEMARVLLLHATTRIKSNKPMSLMASNMTISDSMKSLASFCSNQIYSSIPSPKMFGIPHQATFEDYYERLMERLNENCESLAEIMKHAEKLKGEEQSEKEDSGGKPKPKEGKGNGKERSQGSDQDQGQGSQQEDGEGSQPNEQEQVKSEQEAFERHFNPGKNTNAENWEEDEEVSEDLKNFVQNNIELIKGCGSLSGELQNSIIEAAGKNEINPSTVMRRFLANAESDVSEETRTKPNRRRGWKVPGSVKTMTHHVLCGIDGSASVSDKEIEKIIVEINAMTRIAEIDYVTWDTKVYEESWEKGKKYKPGGNKFKFANSRGGTSPECLFHFAKKRKYKNLVVLTDGEFGEFDMPGNFRICWITTHDTSNFMKRTGKVIELKKWK